MKNIIQMEEYIKNLKLKNTFQTLESFTSDIDYSIFADSLNRKKDKKKFKDHKIIGKKDFINFIGVPNKFDRLFLALDGFPPSLWHKVNTTEEIDQFLSIYSSNKTLLKEGVFRGFLGLRDTSNLSYDSLQKFILLHPFADKIMWGPCYDIPGADVCTNMNLLDIAINITKLTQQNMEKTKEINFFTKYSKSAVTFTEMKGIFFVNVEYYSSVTTNSHEIKKINTLLGHTFEETLPLDVIAILSNFPRVYTCTDLLCINPPEITIAMMVASNIPRYVDQMLHVLNNMYDSREKYVEDDVNSITNALLTLTINREFDRIFSEDMLTENKNIHTLAEKIESHCEYNSQFDKESVILYITEILVKLNNRLNDE